MTATGWLLLTALVCFTIKRVFGKAVIMRAYALFSLVGFRLSLVADCGKKYWYREGKTFDECSADRAACRTELLKRTDTRQLGDYERKYMEYCMQQRGYRLVPEKELPLEARREDSDIPSEVPSARGYGVAGSIGDGRGRVAVAD